MVTQNVPNICSIKVRKCRCLMKMEGRLWLLPHSMVKFRLSVSNSYLGCEILIFCLFLFFVKTFLSLVQYKTESSHIWVEITKFPTLSTSTFITDLHEGGNRKDILNYHPTSGGNYVAKLFQFILTYSLFQQFKNASNGSMQEVMMSNFQAKHNSARVGVDSLLNQTWKWHA